MRHPTIDRDALQLFEYVENKKEEVEIYVNHLVSTTSINDFVEGSKSGAEDGAQEEVVDVKDEGV